MVRLILSNVCFYKSTDLFSENLPNGFETIGEHYSDVSLTELWISDEYLETSNTHIIDHESSNTKESPKFIKQIDWDVVETSEEMVLV
jgi:hypothetical protein